MNILIAILLIFALVGAVDKIIGGRMGLAEELDNGLASMGRVCFSMCGFYCIGITVVRSNLEFFSGLRLPFDVSLLAGCLLAPDLGGWPIALELTASTPMSQFSGLLLSSCLGCTISFILPVFLGALPKAEAPGFMQGVSWGIAAIPAGLIPGGLVLGLSVPELAAALWPVLLFCGILWASLRLAPKKVVFILGLLGEGIRILGIFLFCILAAGVFVPAFSVVESSLFLESMMIIFRITMAICGAMVLCRIVLTHFKAMLRRIAIRLQVNEYAVMGLFISLASSVAMLPLYKQMDPRGKALNAAFSVCGAFSLGGQFAFVASVSPSLAVAAYLLAKWLGGIAGVAVACLATRNWVTPLQQPVPQ